jgi:hypothetical protein
MTPADIVHGTPTWVWILLIFLLIRGAKAMHANTAPLSRLAIIPLIFAGMGIAHLLHSPLAGWSDGIMWIAGLLAGIAAGIFQASRTRFIVDPVARTVMLPGSLVPLMLILATFAVKFWLGFEMATTLDMASLATYTLIGAAVSGVIAGMFAGRWLTYWKAIAASPALTA